MQKTDISNSCNAHASTPGYEHEENEYEDSDVESSNGRYMWDDIWEVDGISCFEDFEESELDGDELEGPWIPSHEDENGSRDLDQYEADSEGHHTDTDSAEEEIQNTNPSGDQDETYNQKPDKESSQETPLGKDNLHSNTPTSPQVSKSNPSPTPEPYQETIALGQHHLWMI